MLTTPKQDGTPYDVPYGHTRVFIGAGFDQVLERVVLCLQLQGFHIMASVDLQDALQGAKVTHASVWVKHDPQRGAGLVQQSAIGTGHTAERGSC